MLKKALLLVLVALLQSFSSLAYADGQKLWFENEGGLSRDHLTNGKVKVTQGFFGSYDLEELVKDNPTALEFTKKQSQFNAYAHLSYWLGVIPSAGFLGYGIGSRDATMGIISAVTLLGTGLLTGYFVSESRHYMYQAINTYNGVSSLRTNDRGSLSSELSAQPGLALNSVSVSFSF